MIERHDTRFEAFIKLFLTGLLGWVIFSIVWYKNIYVAYVVAANIWALVLYYGYRYIKTERVLKSRAARMKRFAQRHGYAMHELQFPRKTKIFQLVLGEKQFFENQMQGDGWRYSDLSYTEVTTTKYGSYDSQTVYYSVLEIALSRSLPNMLFDSPQVHGLGYLTHLDESQRASLEGDFDQYFVTYFPRHYDIDTRSVISPEVMAAMIDSGVSDIEIHGKKLYLYSPLLDVSLMQNLIDDGLRIRDAMMDHAVHYRDDRLAEDARNAGEVSSFGKKLLLKPKMPWQTIILAIAGIVYISAGISHTESFSGNEILAIIIYVFMFCTVAWVEVYKSWVLVRRSNTRQEKRYLKKHGSS